jgi:hypothetical protein
LLVSNVWTIGCWHCSLEGHWTGLLLTWFVWGSLEWSSSKQRCLHSDLVRSWSAGSLCYNFILFQIWDDYVTTTLIFLSFCRATVHTQGITVVHKRTQRHQGKKKWTKRCPRVGLGWFYPNLFPAQSKVTGMGRRQTRILKLNPNKHNTMVSGFGRIGSMGYYI